MKELILDTNFLISFVTDRNLAQQEKAAEVFLQATHLKTQLLCPQSVIIEFTYVLEKIYHQPKKHIRQLVADLLVLPGLEVIQKIDFNWVLTFWPDQVADFGDALVAAAAKVRKEAQVATFDKALIHSLKKLGIKTAPR
jgi:predicted nucleic-acid-binding protein